MVAATAAFVWPGPGLDDCVAVTDDVTDGEEK